MRVLKNCTTIPTRDGRAVELQVRTATREPRRVAAPCGLSTVGLLRLASSQLGLSPLTTMSLAEELYNGGHISYPRTMTTRYPTTLDVASTLGLLTPQPYQWGALASWLALNPPTPAFSRGEDHGDH